MKKLFSIFALLSLVTVVIYSCNEDIELVGEYKKTAVVYGILDKSDTVHYIKITRAFITGPGQDANDIALIPDSSYFESVTGTITEYFIGGGKLRTFTLRDTIVDNKDQNGAFYAPEQKLYYFTTTSAAPLRGDCEYQLDLDINNGAFQVSGRTELVSGISSNSSNANFSFSFRNNQNEFITTSISVNVGNSHIMNTTVDIEYTEWEGTTPTIRNTKWNLGEFECEPNGSLNFTAQGATFYNVMASSVSNNPAVTKRTLNSMTTTITGGAEELAYYMQVNEPSSSLAQTKPTFTNLQATNGQSVVGIFSSRQTITSRKPFFDPSYPILNYRCINRNSTDYLCVGAITGSLLFCSNHTTDINNNEPWICN